MSDRVTALLELWKQLESDAAKAEWATKLLGWMRLCHQTGHIVSGNSSAELFTVNNEWPEPPESSLPLQAAQAIEDSIQFLALLLPRFDRIVAQAWKEPSLSSSELLDSIQKVRKKNEIHLSECLKPAAGIHYSKNWKSLTLIDENENTSSLKNLLANPDDYIARGQVIKTGLSTTVAVVNAGEGEKARQFFIKRYNSKGLFYSLFRSVIPSRAAVTWHAAKLLRSIGVGTARPIALLEKRWGPFKQQSYVVHEFVDSVHGMKFFAEGASPRAEWAEVAQEIDDVLYSLKRSLIAHGDLKGQNFIVRNQELMLVDLDSLQSYKTPESFQRAYQKDMARFERNWLEEPVAMQIFSPIINRLRAES
ncbi:MAG: lipopolysaccharide kinase InaA family protein [Endozoicomonas sp.]